MRTRVRTVASGAAVLVALTAGSAGAGALITGARIQDESVTGADVRDQRLTGRDVADRSLTTDDVGGLTTVGPKGETGPPGTPGSIGLPGLTHRVDGRVVLAGQRRKWFVLCARGEHVFGGGVSSDRSSLVAIEESFPGGDAWEVQVRNVGNVSINVYAWALCAPE